MTPRLNWHPDEGMLQTYAAGGAGLALAASVEAHVLACSACRVALVPAVEPRRLTAVRAALEDRLDAAERPRSERLLRRVGLGEADARVLLAAPSLRRAWWLAVVLVLTLAMLAALQEPGSVDALLILAPLLPVIATAASYTPRLDPATGLTAATPYPTMRLLLLRSGAVAGASTLLAAAASALLPVALGEALAWLLPAAALTVAVLALSSWMDAGVAAGACCAAWLAAVWTVRQDGLELVAVYDAPGQLVSATVLAAAILVLVRHRHRLDPGSPV